MVKSYLEHSFLVVLLQEGMVLALVGSVGLAIAGRH
jgi:hypothetical protein